ncbi:putative ribonuclease H-like domain-containing protein [Tanacetum coccineum]
MNDFCREKGIKRRYSVARTPQQNGVAERKMANSFKPHNKTPYELFRGFKPAIGFMKPFGCHVTILNTLDNLGKFDGKSNEGFFVGYSLNSKAFTDASYFGDVAPRTIVDAQIEDKDGLQDENDAIENRLNTGSKDISTALPEDNTATPEDLVGPIPTTPQTRIHKDHPIEHVIGDVQSSVKTRRMKTSYSKLGFLSAIYEGKSHQDLHTCFEDLDHPNKVYKVVKALYGLHQALRAWSNRKRKVSPKISHLLAVKRIFRYLKGKPSLGLWYSKDSPLELFAYTDSDYAGATQDRKSTTEDIKIELVQSKRSTGKDFFKSINSDSLLRKLLVINAPCFYNEALASQSNKLFGKDYSNPLMAGSLPKTILCVNCEPKE